MGHGVMGIIFMLLHVESIVSDSCNRRLMKGTLDWLASKQTRVGNWPSVRNETSDHKVHFCHGAPGAVYVYLKAHDIFKDRCYLDAAQRAGAACFLLDLRLQPAASACPFFEIGGLRLRQDNTVDSGKIRVGNTQSCQDQ